MHIDSKFVIVGAGLSGLATALALSRVGVKTRLLERRRAAVAPPERGLLLHRPALMAAEALGAGVIAASGGAPIVASRIEDRRGRRLTRMGWAPGGLVAVSGAALREALCDALDPEMASIHRGRAALAVRALGMLVEVTRTDGETERALAVIGADGGQSTIARLIDGDAGLVLDPLARTEAAPSLHLWQGLSPLGPTNLGDGQQIERWARGVRGGAFRLPDGRCAWYLSANADANATPLRACEPLADWLGATIAATAPYRTTRHPRPPRRPSRIAAGPVCVIGQAAWPLPPHIGLGIGLAFEDALALARAVKHAPLGDPALAFARYARLRRRAALRSCRQAWAGAHATHVSSAFAAAGRDLLARLTPTWLTRRATATLHGPTLKI